MYTKDNGQQRQLNARAEEIERDIERIARDQVDLASQRQTMNAARIAVQDELRRQEAFDHAFETSSGGASEYVAVYGGAGGEAADMCGGGFAAARGRLLFPVVARAAVRPDA